MSLLPPRLPPLPFLPVRARDLILLLVLLLASLVAAPFLIQMIWPEAKLDGLLPVLLLLVGQAVWMFFLAWLTVLLPHRLRLVDIGLRPTYRSWYRLAIAIGLICMPVVSLINLGLQGLMGERIDNPQLVALAPEGFSWFSLIAMLLLVGVVVPCVEEIIFRGLVYGWLRKHLRFAFAAPISAVLFASAHLIPDLMPALAVMGLVLASVVERSGSLWPSIIVHGTFNSLMTITYYAALAAGGS